MSRVVDCNHVIDGEVRELVLRIETINILTEGWCFLLPNAETKGAACLR
jgi:hypothetical protein